MSRPSQDQLERLQLMSEGNPTWDLSENDCAAIAAVLADNKRLRETLEKIANTFEIDWAEAQDLARAALSGSASGREGETTNG